MTRSENIIWPFNQSPISEVLGSRHPTNKTVLLHFMYFHDGAGGTSTKNDAAARTASNIEECWKKYISEANLVSKNYIPKLVLSLYEKWRLLKKYKTKSDSFKDREMATSKKG